MSIPVTLNDTEYKKLNDDYFEQLEIITALLAKTPVQKTILDPPAQKTILDSPADWRSVYNRHTWYGQRASGRVKQPAPDFTVIKEVASSNKIRDNGPITNTSQLDQLVSAIKNNDQLKSSQKRFYRWVLYLLHERYVMQKLIPTLITNLQKTNGNAAPLLFSKNEKYSRSDCLRRYRKIKEELKGSVTDPINYKAWRNLSLYYIDHHYEHPSQTTMGDALIAAVEKYTPLLGLLCSIAMLVLTLAVPQSAPILLAVQILTYSSNIGFASLLTSLWTYFYNGYHGLWRPSRAVLIDLIINTISLCVGFSPLLFHNVLGYHLTLIKRVTTYTNVSFTFLTGCINSLKSLFFIRDQESFFYQPQLANYAKYIKHMPYAKHSNFIIYQQLAEKNQLFTDYARWDKRWLHPRRHQANVNVAKKIKGGDTWKAVIDAVSQMPDKSTKENGYYCGGPSQTGIEKLDAIRGTIHYKGINKKGSLARRLRFFAIYQTEKGATAQEDHKMIGNMSRKIEA